MPNFDSSGQKMTASKSVMPLFFYNYEISPLCPMMIDIREHLWTFDLGGFAAGNNGQFLKAYFISFYRDFEWNKD